MVDTTSKIGKKFGRLTVIERDLSKPVGHGKGSYWICKCDCGNIKSIAYSQLSSGKTKSCGCLRSERITEKNTLDLTNKKFGKLTALENTYQLTNHHSYIWKCYCDCGNIHYVSAENLQTGRVNSCGCLQSVIESKISKILIENNISFISQKTFKDLISPQGGKLKFDFAILNDNDDIIRLIEYDGEQHFENKIRKDNGWNNVDNYKILHQNDLLKNEYALKNNIPLIRIPYWEKDNISLKMLIGE